MVFGFLFTFVYMYIFDIFAAFLFFQLFFGHILLICLRIFLTFVTPLASFYFVLVFVHCIFLGGFQTEKRSWLFSSRSLSVENLGIRLGIGSIDRLIDR